MRVLTLAILCLLGAEAKDQTCGRPDAAAIKAELEAIPLSKTDAPIYQKLATQRVTINLAESSLEDAVAFLHEIAGLNVVLSPKVDGGDCRVAFKVKDMRLRDAVFHIVNGLDLGAVVRDEALYIGTLDELNPSEWAQAYDVLDQLALDSGEVHTKIQRQLATQKLTLNFAETELEDVVDFLEDISGINFVISGEAGSRVAEEGLKVSLKVQDVTFASALNLLLSGHELAYRVQHEAVVIMTRDETGASEGRASDALAMWKESAPEATALAPLKQLHRRTAEFLSWGAQGEIASVLDFPLLHGGHASLALLNPPKDEPKKDAAPPKVGFK